MADKPFKSTILSLYRNVLRTNNKLPENLKSIGNAYVRSEFSAMKDAKKRHHVEKFIQEWKNYVSIIEQQSLNQEGYGVDLQESQKSSLDQEKLSKLQELERYSKNQFSSSTQNNNNNNNHSS